MQDRPASSRHSQLTRAAISIVHGKTLRAHLLAFLPIINVAQDQSRIGATFEAGGGLAVRPTAPCLALSTENAAHPIQLSDDCSASDAIRRSLGTIAIISRRFGGGAIDAPATARSGLGLPLDQAGRGLSRGARQKSRGALVRNDRHHPA
jgi:hypothetical protein